MRDFHCHFKTEDAYFCKFEYSLDKRTINEEPLDEQVEKLKMQLSEAVSNKLPVSLHCVRCTQLMIETLGLFHFEKGQVLWHNYTGSVETAAVLYKMGIIISIGPRFKGSIQDTYKANPLLVVETDYVGDNEEEHKKLLEDMYAKVSKALNISQEELEKKCNEVGAFFKN